MRGRPAPGSPIRQSSRSATSSVSAVMSDGGLAAAATEPRVFDLTEPEARAPTAERQAWAPWLLVWIAFVFVSAAAVSSVRRIPFHYALTSSAVDYALLAVVAVAAWHCSIVIQE